MTGERIRMVDVPLDLLDSDSVVEEILTWTAGTQVKVAVGINAHVCNQAATDLKFRRLLYRADLAYPDGQSVVWAARLSGADASERVATTDLVFPLTTRAAESGKRVFLFGSKPGVADAAAARLAEHAPGLQVRAAHGYLNARQTLEMIEEINQWGADILFVGLGDPLQQEWVARHRASLNVPAILTCGGLLDWTSGQHRRPPDWMVRAGLEWLWRLGLEPGRLAARYLVGNPAFVIRYLRSRARSGVNV